MQHSQSAPVSKTKCHLRGAFACVSPGVPQHGMMQLPTWAGILCGMPAVRCRLTRRGVMQKHCGGSCGSADILHDARYPACDPGSLEKDLHGHAKPHTTTEALQKSFLPSTNGRTPRYCRASMTRSAPHCERADATQLGRRPRRLAPATPSGTRGVGSHPHWYPTRPTTGVADWFVDTLQTPDLVKARPRWSGCGC